MISQSNSITRPVAPDASLDYQRLYTEGLKHIEALSGKIWTDYNAHDPGISILEVLCYAITELGYRCDFEIGDIIAPESESEKVLSDFFTLAQVASNQPLTINDFRKLLIDLEGYRNAWLEKVETPSPALYLDRRGENQNFINISDPDDDLLDDDNIKPIRIKGLYDVYLQFEDHPDFGDLNDNSLQEIFLIKPIGKPGPLEFLIEVEFPIWESLDDEWDLIAERLSSSLNTGDVYFTVDLDVTGLQAVTGEEFVYEGTLVINKDTRRVDMPCMFRVMSGTENVINKNEFRPRLADELNGKALVKGDPEIETGVIPLMVKFINRRTVIQGLLEDARKSLAEHRNLCEDFEHLYPMNLQEIGLDVALDVVAGTNVQRVMAEVYHRTQLYLSPTIRFYSLREMLDKGYTAEEIFRGPILANGFIDEGEQAFNLQRQKLFTSDLLQEFMKIEGVRIVKRLTLSRYVRGQRVDANLTECMCLDVAGRFLTRLNISRSSVSIDAGNGKPEEVDKTEALQLLKEYKALNQLKGSAIQGDFAKPVGTYSNLEDYYSIQNEFPANYAIGVEGVASNEPELRKAQARQLKAYLTFFDQLYANFHAQLANVRKLYSYSDEADRTYFTQALWQVPRVQELLADFTGKNGSESWEFYQSDEHTGDPRYYPRRVDDLAESRATFQDRRKRFLDHLLARFNESFSEYAAYVFSRDMDTNQKYDTLIKDQARFLRNYVDHSAARGTGMDYQRVLDPQGYVEGSYFNLLSDVVPGLKKRMVYLTGLPKVGTEYINPFERMGISTNPNPPFGFAIQHPTAHNRWFYSKIPYVTLDALLADMAQLRALVSDKNSFEVQGAELWLKRVDGGGVTYLAAIDALHYDELKSIEENIAPLQKFFEEAYAVENMHIVEHILLRQRHSADPTLNPRIVPNCTALDIEDPYSFRISVILPTWSGRFQELEFRRLYKRLMRMEAPAHIYIHFYWIDPVQMYKFEHCWSNWLDGEWLIENSRLLWQIDSSNSKSPLVQENTFKILLDRRAAGGEFGLFFQDCMNNLRNLLDCYYEVLPTRIVDQYHDACELIARPIDPDGEITRAWLPNPNQLPPGTCINSCGGEIRICDLDSFHAMTRFDYPIDVVTINSAGEVTYSSFIIQFIKNYPATTDIVHPPAHIKKYHNGDILISFKDVDNASDDGDPNNDNLNDFTDGRVDAWFGPVEPGGEMGTVALASIPGISFLGAPDWKIVVTQENDLVAGDYGADVFLADNKGGESQVLARWTILPDHPAELVMHTPVNRSQDWYVQDAVLVTITDEDEGVDNVNLVIGGSVQLSDLGLRTQFNSDPPEWELAIDDIGVFMDALGTYFALGADHFYRRPFTAYVLDKCGGQTMLTFTLAIRQDQPVKYTPEPTKHVANATAGKLMARLEDVNDFGLASIDDHGLLATRGLVANKVGNLYEIRVMANPAIFQGQFQINLTSALVSESFAVPIDTVDGTGGVETVVCTFEVYQDRPAFPTIAPPKHVKLYGINENLATVKDYDRGIASFTLPVGSFTPSTGMAVSKFLGTGAIDSYLNITIVDLNLFLEAAADPLIFVPEPGHPERLAYTRSIDVVDTEGGRTTVQVKIVVLIDWPEPLTNVAYQVSGGYDLSNAPIDMYTTETFVATLSKTGRYLKSADVQNLPAGFGLTDYPLGNVSVIVNNAPAIVPGTYSFSVNTVDEIHHRDAIPVSITVVPIKVANYTVMVTPTGTNSLHFLDLRPMVPGLKITSFVSNVVNGSFNLGDAYFPIFTEGNAFGSAIVGGGTFDYRGKQDVSGDYWKGKVTIARDSIDGALSVKDRFNGRPKGAYLAGVPIFDIFCSPNPPAKFLGSLPPGLDWQVSNLYGPKIVIFVKDPLLLVADHYFISGFIEDGQAIKHSVRFTISILPDDAKYMVVYFNIKPGPSGTNIQLDVNVKVPGLTVTGLMPPVFPPLLPNTYGTMGPTTGSKLGFTPSSSFNSDMLAYPMEFTGNLNSGRVGGVIIIQMVP